MTKYPQIYPLNTENLVSGCSSSLPSQLPSSDYFMIYAKEKVIRGSHLLSFFEHKDILFSLETYFLVMGVHKDLSVCPLKYTYLYYNINTLQCALI